MYCPYCRNQVADNVDFCPNCGTNIKDLRNKNEQPVQPMTSHSVEPVDDTKPMNNINNTSQNNKNSNKINKSKRDLLIIIGIVLVIVIGIALFFIFNKKDDNKTNIPNENNNEVVEETKELSTYQKLKNDYESGNIDVNKYFTELVYYEYDASKLDENYKSDYNNYSDGSIKELLELLETNEKELDTEIVKQFLTNVSLANVTFGVDDSSAQPQRSTTKNYEVKLLDNEEKKNAYNHHFTHVKLSSNGNFLIWYTEHGTDAITEEMADDIANGLESTVSRYENLFGVEYSYSPYIDNKYFNEDYNNAKKLLDYYHIPMSTLKEAMSVYVFDTGSESTLGTYTDEHDAMKIINRSLIFEVLDKDGVINYPYIVLNQGKLNDNIHSFRQVYMHELFHHFQYIYCMENIDSRCPAGIYSEGTANLASALTNQSTTTTNFLNGHATTYTTKADKKLSTMTDGANDGYAMFPYLYVYSQEVENWSDVIMKAHLETKPYEYIQNNTSKEDLNRVSDKVTYGILSQTFENKALISKEPVVIKEKLNTTKTINGNVEAGAMVFYEVSGDTTFEVISGNKDYLGVKFYGYKDGVYSEILANYDKIEADLTYYVRYDKFYIAINNSNLVNSNSYTIKVSNSKFAENSEFVTTFNNYNIEIEMDITIAGVNTNTISKGVMDEQHQKEYLDITTTSMGIISLNNKIYHDFNTGYSYMTQPYGGDVWWKDKSASQVVDLGVILDKLISMKNVTKIADNHYKVKMTKDDIGGLMASGNANASAISGDVYVEVYAENGYITRLEYDFTNMIKGFEKFTTTIKCSNYDNAGDVEIPQSIIDNAQVQ